MIRILDADNDPDIRILGGNVYNGCDYDEMVMLRKNTRYVLKLPDNFDAISGISPEEEIPNYTNDPVCELLCSMILSSLKMPTQKIELCKYKGKICAAYKYFIQDDEILIKFDPVFHAQKESFKEQEAIGINDVANIIGERYPQAIEFFWDMFIVDALTGNNARNVWGVIVNKKLSFLRIAPVVDNGSAFSKGWSDKYIEKIMEDIDGLKTLICNIEIPFADNGNIITHNHYLNENPSKECIEAAMRVVPKIKIKKYCDFIDSLVYSGLLSKIKADFYKLSLQWRYEEILRTVFKKHIRKQLCQM